MIHELSRLCKVKQIPKIQKKTWIELTPPTHPSSKFFFGNPSLTWTEHSNYNNQQLLALYIQTEYTWYATPKYQYWFRAILGRFSKQNKIPRDLDPPTHFHSISVFWGKNSLQAPNQPTAFNCSSYIRLTSLSWGHLYK